MATLNAEELEKKAFAYFSKTNYCNKQVVDKERSLIKYLDGRWDELPVERKDALLDLLFVGDDIREKYSVNRTPADNTPAIQESFPRLFINSGQKINVDFENDLWTWKDEHSGPFSWMSRSQQDLTLADLDAENISKLQSKTLKVDLEEEENVKKAEPQFIHPGNCWSHDIVDDFRKNEANITITPSASLNFSEARAASSLEEINPAFDGSCDDLSASSTIEHSANEDRVSLPSSEKKSKAKDRSRRSPSPKKILHSGSFRKSPLKNADLGDQKLIPKDDTDAEDEHHVFSNPVMETEWSSFVGDEKEVKAKAVSRMSVPEPMVMDRGMDPTPSSPPSGDQIRLVDRPEPLQEARSVPATVASPARSDWSQESTPDHNTHLLKGLQSPEHHAHPRPIHQAEAAIDYTVQSAQNPDAYKRGVNIEEAESEEILTVEMEGDKIKVTSEEVQHSRDSNIPMSGFDFLDNW